MPQAISGAEKYIYFILAADLTIAARQAYIVLAKPPTQKLPPYSAKYVNGYCRP